MSKPYYQDDACTIYHGDCREILSSLQVLHTATPNDGPNVLLLTDPPYGIGADRNTRANKQHGRAVAPSKDYGIGHWDAKPPPAWLFDMILEICGPAIIWGGNYFRLPPSSCWLVWDKDNGDNGYADCELAWTNLKKAVRKIRYRWMGMLQEKSGSDKEPRFHPTQKPLDVMTWALQQSGESTSVVLDPFMGSGTTLRAAKDLGRKAIGIEIEERYCEIAAKRLAQEVLAI